MQPHSLETTDRRTGSIAGEIAACRALLRDGSRTFYAASFLLPRQVRDPASCLYAFCRLADDAVDVDAGRAPAIESLRERLDRAYSGRALNSAVDLAFARTVAHYSIPRELPEALIEGLAWDAEGRSYDSLDDLAAYATRVAGTVGTMMAVLMGVRDAQLLARACDLGVAMQLTNIARDVGEDARAGRIYLPLNWMREAGISPERWLAAPRFTPALGAVIARVLAAASRLYHRADAGIERLPAGCRPGIRAARLLYSEIGHELRRSGLNSVARRTVVPANTKVKRLARSFSKANSPSSLLAEPCLPQAQYLVNAVVQRPMPEPQQMPVSWWDLQGQAERVLEIFEALEHRQRGGEAVREQQDRIAV
jgi:phytoene synthase